jgi:signal transduction histidine kinase
VTRDVVDALDFARSYHVRPVVRGGGHSYFGNSNAAGSLLIWMRPMADIEQQDAFVPKGAPAETKPVTAVNVGTGALWGDVYYRTIVEAGRYVQGGGCLTVGVAGFTLGGGFGSLSKAFGTGAANLMEAEVVTADGQVRIVNAFNDPELFFAMRGGGGTFAVATRLTLRTHPLPSAVGAMIFEVTAKDDATWRELVGVALDTYATRLFNPHWGEQMRFSPGRKLSVTMLAQGRSEAEIRDDWAPLTDWMESRADRLALAPTAKLRSNSLGSADLPLPIDWDALPPDHHHERPDDPSRTRPLDGIDADGRAVHGRIATIPTARGDAFVIAAGPRAIVDRPLRAATGPLLLSLAFLAVSLLLALLAQLRIGLKPLRRLGAMVGEVRTGSRRTIEIAEPTELLPLVSELNTMIETNEQALARARGHVANLAHGLKTPLATLRLELAARRGEGDAALVSLVDRMQQPIRHHLGRARTAEIGTKGVSVPLLPVLTGLTATMAKLYSDREICLEIAVPPDLAVRCDPQDLDELLGNILDNAWRRARSRVWIHASRDGPAVLIAIVDDGAGMTSEEIDTALLKGRRLDEAGGGHGFGLPISRELSELHGGSLELGGEDDKLGGIAARVRLPVGVS